MKRQHAVRVVWLPPPLGEGWGGGSAQAAPTFSTSPHPGLPPEGEGLNALR